MCLELDTVRQYNFSTVSNNKKTYIKQIRKGLSIYKTDNSPFWSARIWNVSERKYAVRSTKEHFVLQKKRLVWMQLRLPRKYLLDFNKKSFLEASLIKTGLINKRAYHVKS